MPRRLQRSAPLRRRSPTASRGAASDGALPHRSSPPRGRGRVRTRTDPGTKRLAARGSPGSVAVSRSAKRVSTRHLRDGSTPRRRPRATASPGGAFGREGIHRPRDREARSAAVPRAPRRGARRAGPMTLPTRPRASDRSRAPARRSSTAIPDPGVHRAVHDRDAQLECALVAVRGRRGDRPIGDGGELRRHRVRDLHQRRWCLVNVSVQDRGGSLSTGNGSRPARSQ